MSKGERISSAHHGHDDDVLFDAQATEHHNTRPTAVCAYGHADVSEFICWQCCKLRNVDAVLRQIELATDRDELRAMKIRF